MQSFSEYYALLGLQPGASVTEIKQAYRQLAKQWHPDSFPNDPAQRQQAEEKIWGQRPIYTVAFSPDGQYILSAGEHQQIALWQRRKT
ncbi:MAG: DnaJ domain-containing protein [Thainema sp.]